MINNALTENYDIIPYAENLLNNNKGSVADYGEMNFLPNYLSKNIGKWMKVEHLIGSSLVSHIGQLIASGVDYIVLKLEGNNVATVICNLKDIRFITVIYNKNTLMLK